MTTRTTSERGFTLIEVAVCAALLALASAATIGAFAGVARGAMPGTMRDAALMTADNAIARARAAAAYATAPQGTIAWPIAASSSFQAAALLPAPALCGGTAASTTVPLAVRTAFASASGTFTVSVDYPPDPCDPAVTLTLVAVAVLPPPVYAPGTTLAAPIPPPARM